MSREDDQAIEREENLLAKRIELRIQPKPVVSNITGKCIECGGAALVVGEILSRWCSLHCRSAWELDNE